MKKFSTLASAFVLSLMLATSFSAADKSHTPTLSPKTVKDRGAGSVGKGGPRMNDASVRSDNQASVASIENFII